MAKYTQSDFSQIHKIVNIGIKGFISWNKKIQQQMLFPVRIQPRTSDSKSDTV